MSRVLFLTRLFNRRLPAPPATTTIRVDVCPPDIIPAREGSWASSLRRAFVPEMLDRAEPGTPLDRARIEFVEALEGLSADEADDLLCRAQHARSMRELWHLRSELYTLIARRMSQNEADTRLSRVNRHFPIRTQRSGLTTTV